MVSGLSKLGQVMPLLKSHSNQVVIAKWLARRLATGEVPGSNLGKGENLLIAD